MFYSVIENQSVFFPPHSNVTILILNKEGGESQSTHLILNDVIFTKLHVSTRSGHLQVSHQCPHTIYNFLFIGVKPEDGHFWPKHVVS
jgi:hypothetical protein